MNESVWAVHTKESYWGSKIADMCCYADGPQGGYAGGSKPARLGHRPCGSTDGRGPEQSGSQDSPKMAAGADGEGGGSGCPAGSWFQFGKMKSWRWTVVMVAHDNGTVLRATGVTHSKQPTGKPHDPDISVVSAFVPLNSGVWPPKCAVNSTHGWDPSHPITMLTGGGQKGSLGWWNPTRTSWWT